MWSQWGDWWEPERFFLSHSPSPHYYWLPTTLTLPSTHVPKCSGTCLYLLNTYIDLLADLSFSQPPYVSKILDTSLSQRCLVWVIYCQYQLSILIPNQWSHTVCIILISLATIFSKSLFLDHINKLSSPIKTFLFTVSNHLSQSLLLGDFNSAFPVVSLHYLAVVVSLLSEVFQSILPFHRHLLSQKVKWQHHTWHLNFSLNCLQLYTDSQ